jgi:hypothetical protein
LGNPISIFFQADLLHPQENGLSMIDKENDMRIIGVMALVALTLFTFCGMELASKVDTKSCTLFKKMIISPTASCSALRKLKKKSKNF